MHILFPALALSIGWGIRGNFGHEHGAMLAGVLGTVAAVIASGREDWFRRVAFFALFAGVGWCFGGSMSYMMVIAYTHSGHSPTVIYGFAMLFVIGFLWGAIGGGIGSLPAFLTRERLVEFLPPVFIYFGFLVLHEWIYDAMNNLLAGAVSAMWSTRNGDFRQNDPLYWLDTQWTSVLLAVVVFGGYALYKRKLDKATSLMLHMAVGWWVAFLILPVALGIRMTPPRGDSWAGCLGMVIGMWLFFRRNGLHGATWASIFTGFVGGIGFSGGALLKLIEMKSGWTANWHSVLEQSYGFINGIGVAIAFWILAHRTPQVESEPHKRNWSDWFVPASVLLGITWLNVRSNAVEWVKHNTMKPMLYWISAYEWYCIAWLIFSAAVAFLMVRHLRKPIEMVPSSWLGKSQLLFLVFLWIMVVANFERAVVSFSEQRLITEGVIHVNAVVCTLIVLLMPFRTIRPELAAESQIARPWEVRKLAIRVSAVSAIFIVLSWGIVRGIYGNEPASHSGLHYRFGPKALLTDPKKGAAHP